MSDIWHVYMLRCADDTYYTGIAKDISRRLQQHNGELAGGARYTSGRRPVQLLWSEKADSRSKAQKREAQVKSLSRPEKVKLVAS